jgi:hypothetical protein
LDPLQGIVDPVRGLIVGVAADETVDAIALRDGVGDGTTKPE